LFYPLSHNNSKYQSAECNFGFAGARYLESQEREREKGGRVIPISVCAPIAKKPRFSPGRRIFAGMGHPGVSLSLSLSLEKKEEERGRTTTCPFARGSQRSFFSRRGNKMSGSRVRPRRAQGEDRPRFSDCYPPSRWSNKVHDDFTAARRRGTGKSVANRALISGRCHRRLITASPALSRVSFLKLDSRVTPFKGRQG